MVDFAFEAELSPEAVLATEFLKSWGGTAVSETANELANRACETAKVAVRCFRSRGWMKGESG